MKNTFLGLLIITCSVLAGSCIKAGGECEEPLFVTNSSVVVDFKDSTGKYLYSEVAPTYNKDSLRVLDEQSGTLVSVLSTLNNIPNTGSRHWRIDIGPLYNSQTDASSFNMEVCKNFILRYRPNEFDTLGVCFKSKKTKCGSVFETLKVYYKGRLIGTETNQTGINLILVKK